MNKSRRIGKSLLCIALSSVLLLSSMFLTFITAYGSESHSNYQEYTFEENQYVMPKSIIQQLERGLVPYRSKALTKQLLEWTQGKVLLDTVTSEDGAGTVWIIGDQVNQDVFAVGVHEGETGKSFTLHDQRDEIIRTKWRKSVLLTRHEEVSEEELAQLQNYEIEQISEEQEGSHTQNHYTVNQLEETEQEISEEAFIIPAVGIAYAMLDTEFPEAETEAPETDGTEPHSETEPESMNVESETDHQTADTDFTETETATTEMTEMTEMTDSETETEAETENTPASAQSRTCCWKWPGCSHGHFQLGRPEDREGSLHGHTKADWVSEDIFKIQIDMEGQSQLKTVKSGQPIDVILAVDLSNSMDQHCGVNWKASKRAMDRMISILLASHSPTDVRIGMVGFGSTYPTGCPGKGHKDLAQPTTNANQLRSVYTGKSAAAVQRSGYMIAGGTNSEAGFIAARQMLERRSAQEKADRRGVVVYLTDGETTHHYAQKDEAADYFLETASRDTSQAKAEGQKIKDLGYTVYTVGLGKCMIGSARELLQDTASDVNKFIMAYDGDLEDKFRAIAEDIETHQEERDHTYLELENSMSQYVNYVKAYKGVEMKAEVFNKGSSAWQEIPEAERDLTYVQDGDGKITLKVKNFSSQNKYRLTYHVQLKPTTYGKRLHKNQTSGKTPQSGTDGVIANGYTWLKSDLVNASEVMVPTVYLGSSAKPEIQDPTLKGHKTSHVQDDDEVFNIRVEMSGKPKISTITENVPVDVVLAVDLSYSMEQFEHKNWLASTKSMDKIIDVLLGSGSTGGDIRMGMVGFGSASESSNGKGHKVLKNLTADAGQLKSVYTAVSGNYYTTETVRKSGYAIGQGTNSEAGFIAARQMLEGRSEADRQKRVGIVVYLTDGETTYHYTKKDEVGDSYAETDSGDIQQAKDEGDKLKNLGYTIYSVGLNDGTKGTAKQLLEYTASSPVKMVMASDQELAERFKEIGDDIIQTRYTTEHSYVQLEDPMSEYVTYLDSYNGRAAVIEISMNQGTTWTALPQENWEITHDPGGKGKLTAKITRFNSDYLYRLSYYVRIKPDAVGKKLHQNQTSGANPESGTDGVVANGYTYLTSDLVNEQEVLVPTVYSEVKTEPALNGTKTAAVIDRNSGKYTITVLFTGNHGRVGDQVSHELKGVTLTDNMSQYVDFISLDSAQAADQGQDNWQDFPGAYLEYIQSLNVIMWDTGLDFDENKQYRLIYTVQVKEEHAGKKIHKEQTSGANPESGTDGVVANGYTGLSSNLVEEELMVPAVYRESVSAAFSFQKVGKEGDRDIPLAGAQFKLKRCTKSEDTGHTHTPDSDCWTEVESGKIFTSDKNGLVDFGNITSGEYLLREIKAPLGYETPTGYWIVSIKNDKSITINGYEDGGQKPPAFKTDGAGKYALPNLKVVKLPHSGHTGIRLFLITGMALISGGLIWYRKERKGIR